MKDTSSHTENRPPEIRVESMTKRFGELTALDSVSVRFEPGTFHALLGENGAGKSTLVKCMMGFYRADSGKLFVDGTEHQVNNPRLANHLGLGMVYQMFTLVPSMTVAENLVLGEENLPQALNWRRLTKKLEKCMDDMPFRLDLNRTAGSLSAGEKQKLEILKQLYHGTNVLILDEPTSVLTPQEADQMLGLMRQMTDEKKISVILITHKLREVETFASEVSVLRHGALVGQGRVSELNHADMVRMMIGRENIPQSANRNPLSTTSTYLEIRNLSVENDKGLIAVNDASLSVSSGEIVAIAGVSGNGQSELVEALAGQRKPESGEIEIAQTLYRAERRQMRSLGVHLLPEEPLRNACVGSMSVAENLAFHRFDDMPFCRSGLFVDRQEIRRRAIDMISKFSVKTQGPDAPIRDLSGGNVQRAVLARELWVHPKALIVQNPCFGLDLNAVAEIRNRIMEARNAGAAVLLISEDLDEIMELADRILVMFDGRIVFETDRENADMQVIGRHMSSEA